MPASSVYTFTVRPNPDSYPARELEAIGSFTVAISADHTVGELVDAIDEEFDFELDSGLFKHKPHRNLLPESKVGEAGLAVGDVVYAGGWTDLLLQLTSISIAGRRRKKAPAFDASGFNAELMTDVVAEAHATEQGDPDPLKPVYRIALTGVLENRGRGEPLILNRWMRWPGQLALGLLATIAVDQADGLLDRTGLTLSVCPDGSAEGWLNFAGADYEVWKDKHLDELGVEPDTILSFELTHMAHLIGLRFSEKFSLFDCEPVSEDQFGPAADLQACKPRVPHPNSPFEVRGWRVRVRPQENDEVRGDVRFAVMTNGDYWKFRTAPWPVT